MENLLEAWMEFVGGKTGKNDVREFSLHLMENLTALHRELSDGSYCHGEYHAFNICDPKPRNIHKATVRDRIVHRALYRKLYPFFDKTFISDSYSCRVGKGTHKAGKRFISFARKVGKNNTKTVWVLKCDIRKFFASIDHEVLKGILRKYISDEKILGLLDVVIESFSTTEGKGLPLGNLTSQLFANVHMNEFDQFAKHKLKAKYYVRYADDFVFLSVERACLEKQIPLIGDFLSRELKIELHPQKLFLKTLVSGVDFLGWVHFPDHCVLRTTTKRRMLKRIATHPTKGTFASYLGLLKHGNAGKLKKGLEIYRQ
ncbi:MAG: reverse transcriptase/maturase family protein [Candidatus Parcubacteria bacterium]|nr:reverse transcriptase/maturase family protein [Candidatus Parcubacteria bacterium]